MYRDYLHEYGKEIYETYFGFYTYSKENEVLCVWDIYVQPQYRRKYFSQELFKSIVSTAIDSGCSEIEGYVDKDYREKERSISVLKAVGFKEYNETDECIWFRVSV